MKIAVIGTGAAAFGALTALMKWKKRPSIDLFSWETQFTPRSLEDKDHRTWSPEDFDRVHQNIQATTGRKFPPPKSHFGELVPRHATRTKHTFWRSATDGGLTKNWSASLLPFSDHDFAEWPITRKDLQPYYQDIAEQVGISGERDALNAHFGDDFVNRPPIGATPLSAHLIEAVNSLGASDGFAAGINRVGLDTRHDSATGCVSCGGCFYGCFKKSVFNAGHAIEKITSMAEPSALRRIQDRVVRLKPHRGSVTIDTLRDSFTGYDRVICAAGCLGSAEIALRSEGMTGDGIQLIDNTIHIFPLLHPFGRRSGTPEAYTAIANVIIGQQAKDRPYCEAHVAPLPDYLLRFYVPGGWWTAIQPIAHALRSRVMFGKLYMDGSVSPRFTARLGKNGNLKLEAGTDVPPDDAGKDTLKDLAGILIRRGFILPYFTSFRAATSSHYAGSLARHLPGDSRLGEVLPRVHFVDSSVFPNSPAQPLTFTIMANASRIATELQHAL